MQHITRTVLLYMYKRKCLFCLAPEIGFFSLKTISQAPVTDHDAGVSARGQDRASHRTVGDRAVCRDRSFRVRPASNQQTTAESMGTETVAKDDGGQVFAQR